MRIDGFDWDGGNILKNLIKHGLSKSAIEDFFKKSPWIGPDVKHSDEETRFLAVGYHRSGKPMIVAFTIRVFYGANLIRPISARKLEPKEVQSYEKAFTKLKNR